MVTRIIIATTNQIVYNHYDINDFSSISVFIVYVSMHFVYEAQFLKATSVFAAPAVAVISPVAKNVCVWIIIKTGFDRFCHKFNACTIFHLYSHHSLYRFD